jgi:vacuolar-type H+-ATPase subunit H
VYSLFESFKTLLEKEREADRIIVNAKEQAELIVKKAQEKAGLAYKRTYDETIDLAKQKSTEIKDKAKKDAESNAQLFIENAEKLKKKLLVFGKKRSKEATDNILREILS